MGNIIIHNHGVVNICNTDKDTVAEAHDKLLRKMYYARNKQTFGEYKGWLKLLDMYYAFEYDDMIEFIKSCKGYGGKTRNECIRYIETIMKGGVR